MLQNIPPEITICSFSLVGILTGYIWNSQNKNIKEIKDTQNSRPCSLIASDISSIKNDIFWIKQILNNVKK